MKESAENCPVLSLRPRVLLHYDNVSKSYISVFSKLKDRTFLLILVVIFEVLI